MNARDDESGRPDGGDGPSGLKVLGVVLLIIAALFVVLLMAAGSMNLNFDPCTC